MSINSLRDSVMRLQQQSRNAGASRNALRPRDEHAANTGNSTLDLSSIGQALRQRRESADSFSSQGASTAQLRLSSEEAESLGLEFETDAKTEDASTTGNPFNSLIDNENSRVSSANSASDSDLRLALLNRKNFIENNGVTLPGPDGMSFTLTRREESSEGKKSNVVNTPENTETTRGDGRRTLDTLDPEFAARFAGLSHQEAADALQFLNSNSGNQDTFTVLTGENGQLIFQDVQGTDQDRIFTVDENGLKELALSERNSIFSNEEQDSLNEFFANGGIKPEQPPVTNNRTNQTEPPAKEVKEQGPVQPPEDVTEQRINLTKDRVQLTGKIRDISVQINEAIARITEISRNPNPVSVIERLQLVEKLPRLRSELDLLTFQLEVVNRLLQNLG